MGVASPKPPTGFSETSGLPEAFSPGVVSEEGLLQPQEVGLLEEFIEPGFSVLWPGTLLLGNER